MSASISYRDLRDFIEQVDELGALRRIERRRPARSSSAASPRSRPASPECPGAAVRPHQRLSAPAFAIFTNATTNAQRAALALGIDPVLQPLDALKAWMQQAREA